MLLAVFLFLFSPLPSNYSPPVGGKFWLVGEHTYDCWEAEVVERDGRPGLWYKYPSLDGLVLNDYSSAPRSYVYRCKLAAQVEAAKLADLVAQRAAFDAELVRSRIGK